MNEGKPFEMHYAFDRWMEREFPQNPWARYADDGIVHCRTKEEAERILQALTERMLACKLEIHQEKSRIVYCRSERFNGRSEQEAFDFLGYTFRRRPAKSKTGRFCNSFAPAVSKSAGQKFRDRIKKIRHDYRLQSLEALAETMNPVIRGWYNYFSVFCASAARKVLDHVNRTLVRYIRFKYKAVKRSRAKAYRWLIRIAKIKPNLFYHWQMGLRPTSG